MKFLSIILLTFRESFAKKTFVGFLAISSIVLLLFIFALNLDIVDGAQSAVSVFGIQAAAVNPPLAAAKLPETIVSSSSLPGSLKCTCISKNPGIT